MLYEYNFNRPKISPTAFISDSATIIGNVTIGDYCYIGPGAVIRSERLPIVIGDETAVEDGVIIHTGGAKSNGTIIGKHAVHGYLNLGRIDIATFDNPNGLSAVGGTLFEQTVASGEPKVAIAGQEGAGEVVSGALEMSNVDLAQEFTDMITTQRGYQANSRVITTSDTMLEELLSLKR